MKAAEYLELCQKPARRILQQKKKEVFIRMAKKYTGSAVLKNWKHYLFGGGQNALDFENLYPVSPQFQAQKEPEESLSTNNPFNSIYSIFKKGEQHADKP